MNRSVLLASLLFACSDGSDDVVVVDDTTVDDTTPEYPSGIQFDVVFGDEPVACGTDLVGVGPTTATASLKDLRFYISDLELSGPSGTDIVIPDQDGVWQYATTILLDFEDGTADCAATGNADLNSRVEGFIPEGEWDTLTFTVGVPEQLNHLDAASQPSPMNLASMFWNWQGGYKFLRIDLDNGRPGDSAWNLHIGSSGCSSDTPADPPDTVCERPNRARISVPFDPFTDEAVVLDLAALFIGVDPLANTDMSPPGCMCDPNDTSECAPVFSALGMSYATGECVDDCANQGAFSSR